MHNVQGLTLMSDICPSSACRLASQFLASSNNRSSSLASSSSFLAASSVSVGRFLWGLPRGAGRGGAAARVWEEGEAAWTTGSKVGLGFREATGLGLVTGAGAGDEGGAVRATRSELGLRLWEGAGARAGVEAGAGVGSLARAGLGTGAGAGADGTGANCSMRSVSAALQGSSNAGALWGNWAEWCSSASATARYRGESTSGPLRASWSCCRSCGQGMS